MKKASNVKEVTALVSAHMRSMARTNNFLKAEDYEKAFSKNALYYEEWQNGITVIQKREGFFNLKFNLNGFEDFPALDTGVYVAEITGREKTDENLKNYLLKNGFRLLKERIRLIKKNPPLYEANSENVSFPDISEAKKAYALILENFDKYSGCIPDFDEFEEDVFEKKAIVYKNPDVCGILHFCQSGKTSEIRHLAVSGSARGKGAAASMIKYYTENSGAARFLVWTGADNEVAIKLYTDNGYEKDGMISEVYIK